MPLHFRVTSLETTVHPFQCRELPLLSWIQRMKSFLRHAISRVTHFYVSADFLETLPSGALSNASCFAQVHYYYYWSGTVWGLGRSRAYSENCISLLPGHSSQTCPCFEIIFNCLHYRFYPCTSLFLYLSILLLTFSYYSLSLFHYIV